MTAHLRKEISIDLFNLPLLPDERNSLDAYMDVPYNFTFLMGRTPDSWTVWRGGTQVHCKILGLLIP